MAELRRLQGLVAEVDAELTKYKENDPEAHKHMCELLVGRGGTGRRVGLRAP